MANTYTLIASSTASGGSVANIEFTSIPATYTDLLVLLSLRSARSNDEDGLFMGFNSNTSNYSWKALQGNGTAASSFSGTDRFAGQLTAATTTSNTFTNTSIYIPNYAGSDYKSYSIDNVTESNVTKAYAQPIAGLWSNTSAITSIIFLSDSSNNLAQYSSAYLYGIKNS